MLQNGLSVKELLFEWEYCFCTRVYVLFVSNLYKLNIFVEINLEKKISQYI